MLTHFELPLSVLYRTRYARRPAHIVPRLTAETKDNFFLATLMQNGFAVEVEGEEDVSPSPSQTVAVTKLLLEDIVRRGKSPIKLKIQLNKFLPDGYSRYQLKVRVIRNSEVYNYCMDSRGNSF